MLVFGLIWLIIIVNSVFKIEKLVIWIMRIVVFLVRN